MIIFRLLREVTKHACFFFGLLVVIILAAVPERSGPRLVKRN